MVIRWTTTALMPKPQFCACYRDRLARPILIGMTRWIASLPSTTNTTGSSSPFMRISIVVVALLPCASASAPRRSSSAMLNEQQSSMRSAHPSDLARGLSKAPRATGLRSIDRAVATDKQTTLRRRRQYRVRVLRVAKAGRASFSVNQCVLAAHDAQPRADDGEPQMPLERVTKQWNRGAGAASYRGHACPHWRTWPARYRLRQRCSPTRKRIAARRGRVVFRHGVRFTSSTWRMAKVALWSQSDLRRRHVLRKSPAISRVASPCSGGACPARRTEPRRRRGSLAWR